MRGINPGLHGMSILENGDLTLLRSSAGLYWDAPGSHSDHGGAHTKARHLVDLENNEVKGGGVAFFNCRVRERRKNSGRSSRDREMISGTSVSYS